MWQVFTVRLCFRFTNSWISLYVGMALCGLAERVGSGDGERKTLLTRQIAFEPLPASVLFAPFVVVVICSGPLMVVAHAKRSPSPQKEDQR